MKTSRSTSRVRASLVLLCLLGLGLALMPLWLVPPATLALRVNDRVFHLDLDGQAVRVVQAETGAAAIVNLRRVESAFVAEVPRVRSGHGTFTVETEGYHPATVTIDLAPLERAEATIELDPSFGRLEVSVHDAKSDSPVAAKLIPGSHSPLQSPTGDFVLPHVPPGQLTLSADAAGFCRQDRSVLIKERETTRVTVPLSPALSSGERARITLDWGPNPRDLDSHLTAPGYAPDGAPTLHVYWNNKQGRLKNGSVYAALDVDYRHAEGFETITVHDNARGAYSYFVMLYAGEGTLGSSGAQVRILQEGCNGKTYSVPGDCANVAWHVADIVVDGSRLQITDRNACVGADTHKQSIPKQG